VKEQEPLAKCDHGQSLVYRSRILGSKFRRQVVQSPDETPVQHTLEQADLVQQRPDLPSFKDPTSGEYWRGIG
jgi:hypothetical protein